MKYLIHLIILTSFTFSAFAYQMGDFVKDITFKDLVFNFPNIAVTKATDGTELLSLTNKDFPIVFAEFQVYYGRKNIGNGNTEITRLLKDSWEFSGSKAYPKDSLLQEFEKLGATFSLSIDYDKTTISMSYLKKDEARIVELFRSFWIESNLDNEVIETMRSRIADEIKRRNDNPTSLGMRKIKERVFDGTILGKVSSLSGLESITRDQLIQFQSEIVSEKKRILLLTGDAEPETWKKYITGITIANADQMKAEEVLTESLVNNLSRIKGKHVLVEKEVSQAFVVMMGALPRHNDPDFYAIQVLNYMIGGGGFNSYYMREIRNNRGLAYSAGSQTDFQKGYGTIHFYAMTKAESTVEVLGLMKDLIKEDFIAKLQQAELKRAQIAITNQFVFLFSDSKKVLQNDLRFREHEMSPDYLIHFRENIEKVTLEDLVRVGKKYFNPQGLSVLVVGPKSLKESLGVQFQIIQPEENASK
ncbi:MAG: pitrilysin family protein [Leptospira sp.]|nr:pitrilysin family protein [Leptospira sp.]